MSPSIFVSCSTKINPAKESNQHSACHGKCYKSEQGNVIVAFPWSDPIKAIKIVVWTLLVYSGLDPAIRISISGRILTPQCFQYCSKDAWGINRPEISGFLTSLLLHKLAQK